MFGLDGCYCNACPAGSLVKHPATHVILVLKEIIGIGITYEISLLWDAVYKPGLFSMKIRSEFHGK
jgi:hypothetical protein